MLSPFVSSATGIGFEQISYLWSGFGVWSQLFAMWTLPFAWACSWRAVDEHRYVVPAAVAVAATAAFHFETGYLAFLGIAVFVLVRPSHLLRRAGRAILVVGGAAALSAFAIVPLIAQGKWAAINQFLQSGINGADANSYGARRVLSWLVDGDLFDWHHLELLTPLVAIGLTYCLVAWQRDGERPIETGTRRALVSVFAMSLLLFFGRPTLGPILELLPGSQDLFLRRFLVGVQLAGLLLAGVGAELVASWTIAGAKRMLSHKGLAKGRRATLGGFVVGCVGLIVLVPAWSFALSQADHNASLIAEQSAAQKAATHLDILVKVIEKGGGDGSMPVIRLIGERVSSSARCRSLSTWRRVEVDEVGFTLRTASLMSDPEVTFDAANPADYEAFGVRWLILPSSMTSPVPADLVEVQGNYSLWEIPSDGYVQVVDTARSVTATSSDLGSFSAAFLVGLPTIDPVYPTVAYEGAGAAPGTIVPGSHSTGPPGRVLAERADLDDGTVVATVSATRNAVVLLSAAYDPGWQAFVDGHFVATEMVAPALVGVRVEKGRHTVRFVYRGFPDYPQLFVLGAAALLLLVLGERHRRIQPSRPFRARGRRPS